MGFGKGFTARPGDKVVHAAPPGFHFVVAFGVGVWHESATLVVKANRAWTVNFVAKESRRLCSEYDLDPLGVISSGALIIGCESDSTAAILEALQEAGIRANLIGVVREQEFGVMLKRSGELQEMPVFAADEITRLFMD